MIPLYERYRPTDWSQVVGQDRAIRALDCLRKSNGVQGYVQHEMPRHGRPGDMQRAILSLEDAAVGRATELALSLAV